MNIAPGLYRTRSGEKYRVLSVEGPNPLFPVVGYREQSRVLYTHTPKGRSASAHNDSLDLVAKWTVDRRKSSAHTVYPGDSVRVHAR
jgi:hypothetical protein